MRRLATQYSYTLWLLYAIGFVTKYANGDSCRQNVHAGYCGGSGSSGGPCDAHENEVASYRNSGRCFSIKYMTCCTPAATQDVVFTVSWCKDDPDPSWMYIFSTSGGTISHVVDTCPAGWTEEILENCGGDKVTRRCTQQGPTVSPTPSPTDAPKPVGCTGSYNTVTGQCTSVCYDVWSPDYDCTVCKCENSGACVLDGAQNRICDCPSSTGWNGLLCDVCGTDSEKWDDTTGSCDTCKLGFAETRCTGITNCVNGEPRVDFNTECSSCHQLWPGVTHLPAEVDITSWEWDGINCDASQAPDQTVRDYCVTKFGASSIVCTDYTDIRDWTAVAPLCAESYEQLLDSSKAREILDLASVCLFRDQVPVEYFESRYDFLSNIILHETGLEQALLESNNTSLIRFQYKLDRNLEHVCTSLCPCGSFGSGCLESTSTTEESIELARFYATRCDVEEKDTMFIPGTHLARALFCARHVALTESNLGPVADQIIAEILMIAKKHMGERFYDTSLESDLDLFLVDKVVRTAEAIALFDFRGQQNVDQVESRNPNLMPVFTVDMLQAGSAGGSIPGVQAQLDQISSMVDYLNELDNQNNIMKSTIDTVTGATDSINVFLSEQIGTIQTAFLLDLENSLRTMDIQATARQANIGEIYSKIDSTILKLIQINDDVPAIISNIIAAIQAGIGKSFDITAVYNDLQSVRAFRDIIMSVVMLVAGGAGGTGELIKGGEGSRFKAAYYVLPAIAGLIPTTDYPRVDPLDINIGSGDLFYDLFDQIQTTLESIKARVEEATLNLNYTINTWNESSVDIGAYLGSPVTPPVSSAIWMDFYRQIKHFLIFEMGYCEEPPVNTDFQEYMELSRRRILLIGGGLQKELKELQEDLSEIIDDLNGNCSLLDDTLLTFAEYAQDFHEAADEYVSDMTFLVAHYNQKQLKEEQQASTAEAFGEASRTASFQAADIIARQMAFTEMFKSIRGLDVIDIEHIAMDTLKELCKAYRYANPPGPVITSSGVFTIDPSTCDVSTNFEETELDSNLASRLSQVRTTLQSYVSAWEETQLSYSQTVVSGSREQRCSITKPSFFNQLFDPLNVDEKLSFNVNLHSFRDFCFVNAEIEEVLMVFFDEDDRVVPESSFTKSVANLKLKPKSNFIKFTTTNNKLDEPHEFIPSRDYEYTVEYYKPVDGKCDNSEEKMFNFGNGETVCNKFIQENREDTFFRPTPYTTWEVKLFSFSPRLPKPTRAEVIFKLRANDAYDSSSPGRPCDTTFNMLGELDAAKLLQDSEGATCQWVFDQSAALNVRTPKNNLNSDNEDMTTILAGTIGFLTFLVIVLVIRERRGSQRNRFLENQVGNDSSTSNPPFHTKDVGSSTRNKTNHLSSPNPVFDAI